MRNFLLYILCICSLSNCSNSEYGTVIDKQSHGNDICTFIVRTYDFIDPYIYTTDSCEKYEVRELILLKNIQ